jgi:hypothetical protein
VGREPTTTLLRREWPKQTPQAPLQKLTLKSGPAGGWTSRGQIGHPPLAFRKLRGKWSKEEEGKSSSRNFFSGFGNRASGQSLGFMGALGEGGGSSSRHWLWEDGRGGGKAAAAVGAVGDRFLPPQLSQCQ